MVTRNQRDKIINRFLGNDISEKEKKHLKAEMRNAMLVYRWDFEEFFLFGFESANQKKRLSFVPEYDKNIFCDLINDPKSADLFLDKWDTYAVYKDFFKRAVIRVRSVKDIQDKEVQRFTNDHSRFIIKPAEGTRGIGIEVFDSDKQGNPHNYLRQLLSKGIKNIVCEELIDQHPILASLHPASCNTVRICTLNYGDRVSVIRAFLRMGRGNSVVDNAGAGGIFGNINLASGEVYAACDELGNSYSVHPESMVSIIGFRIPEWQKALEFAKSLAKVRPEVKYVGWDVALTKDGWVLIEGNDKGQFVFQYPAQEGFRDEMNQILHSLNR